MRLCSSALLSPKTQDVAVGQGEFDFWTLHWTLDSQMQPENRGIVQANFSPTAHMDNTPFLRLAHQPQVSTLSHLPFSFYNRQHWFSHLEAFLNSFPKFRTIDKVKLKRVQLVPAIYGANVRHERRLNKIRSKCPMPVLNQTVTIFLEMKIEKDAYKTWKKKGIINENMLKIFAYRNGKSYPSS